MSRLAKISEKAAIRVIESILPRFGELEKLEMSAEDAFELRKAENLLRAVLDSSPYYVEPKN